MSTVEPIASAPLLSVVVLSHNRRDDLIPNLKTLLDQADDEGLEVIVVDNASTDGSPEALREMSERCPHLQVVFSLDNLLYAKGKNMGYEMAKGTYIVNLDDDSSMRAEDLRRVPGIFSQHPEAGIIAFRVDHAVTGECENDHGDAPVAVGNFHGAGNAFRRDIFAEVGGLDTECKFGGEELDYSIRAHAAGYFTVYEPSIVVRHNSFQRPGAEGRWRAERWAKGFSRVVCKHFPHWMGALYAFRYTRQCVIWNRRFGTWWALGLYIAGARGIMSGWRSHKQVPPDTVKFYSNPNLLPVYGNAPINWRTILPVRAALKIGRIARGIRSRP